MFWTFVVKNRKQVRFVGLLGLRLVQSGFANHIVTVAQCQGIWASLAALPAAVTSVESAIFCYHTVSYEHPCHHAVSFVSWLCWSLGRSEDVSGIWWGVCIAQMPRAQNMKRCPHLSPNPIESEGFWYRSKHTRIHSPRKAQPTLSVEHDERVGLENIRRTSNSVCQTPRSPGG